MDSRNGMKLAGLALCLSLATGLSACSSVPDWVDPTSWFGGDSNKSSDNDSGLSSAGQEAQNQDTAGQTPDLADVPQKPAPENTAQASSTETSLASDRSRANYSADALRGGTEAAAPPPPASAPTDQQVAEVSPTPSAAPASDDSAASDNSSSSSDQSASNAAPAAPAPSSDTPAAPASDISSSSADQTPSMPGTLPDSGSAPAPAPAPQPVAAPAAPPPAPAPVQMASNEPPPANTAPAPAEAVAAAPPPAPRTDALGFAPSAAPPLDPSVGQFVSPNVVNHYQQTQMASIAPVYGYSTLSAGSVGTRAAVVKFSGDTTVLDAAGRQEVEAAAEAFRARGAGYIRVVGHASSRDEAVSPERHLQLDFDHSQARATAVAMALIKAGVPADKVLVEAVGDSAPVRAVGTGNDRSAEIFIQG